MTQITVAEALRVKNELAALVSELQQKVAYASCGDTLEDGVLTTKKNVATIKEALPQFEKALKLSFATNSILARFNNSQSSLADNVRELENVKALQRVITTVLQKSEPQTANIFSVLSNARVKVKTEFVPYFTKSELKLRLRDLKLVQRGLQSRIDTFNSQAVELPFELEELEELSG